MKRPTNIQLLTIFSILSILILSIIQYHLTTTTYQYQDRQLKKEIQKAVDQITTQRTVFDSLGNLTLESLHKTIRKYAVIQDSLKRELSKVEGNQQMLIQQHIDGIRSRFKDTLSAYRNERLNEFLNQHINNELRKKDIQHVVKYANILTEVLVGVNSTVVDTLFSGLDPIKDGVLFAGVPIDFDKSIRISSGYVNSKDYDVLLDSLYNNKALRDTSGYVISFRTLEYVEVENWDRLLFKKTWTTLSAAIGSIVFVVVLFFITLRTLFKQKRLNEIKTDFINNMTHELQTPIATLGIASKTLQQDAILNQPQSVKSIAQTIERQHLRLNKLVRQVVEQSVSGSNITLNLEDKNIQNFLETTLHDFKMKHLNDSIQLNTRLQTENIITSIDPFHLRTAISNILENAYKYNSEGVTISVNSFIKKDSLYIEIKDDGIGIPSKQQQLIFEKFYRVPTGNIHNVKGLGLGLYLAKQVIEAHNGTIELQKTEKGASFLIRLKQTTSNAI